MTRQDFLLAVLAAGDGEAHQPAQVQKLFFLLDRKVPKEVGGPWFNFKPCDYGPFDKAVYEEMLALGQRRLVAISAESASLLTYSLTPAGWREGSKEKKVGEGSLEKSTRRVTTTLMENVTLQPSQRRRLSCREPLRVPSLFLLSFLLNCKGPCSTF